MRVCAAAGRHGIEAARVERMAAREALECEQAAAEGAEAQHRFERVLRAARMEAARGPEHRAHGPLIQTNTQGGELAHCSPTLFHSVVRVARSVAAEAARAGGRALTTRSTAG